MGHDPYEHRGDRDDRSRWERERSHGGGDPRGHGGHDERGFFERAGEEISSWFGGGDDDRGRRDHHREIRDRHERDEWMSHGRERGRGYQRDRDYRDAPEQGRSFGRSDREHDRGGYRAMTGDYGRSGPMRGGFGEGDHNREPMGQSKWDRDDYRGTSFAGSAASSNYEDRHYHECRQRHMDEFERDYDEYRRERNSRFESDFGSWRERRQSKREMLGRIRENMDVVGSDGRPLGTVERVAGDRIILTPSDPDAGGSHHSLSCTDIDRVEGNRLILETSADKAKERWRNDSRERALFEREDQGTSGPHMLDRSFSGTYR